MEPVLSTSGEIPIASANCLTRAPGSDLLLGLLTIGTLALLDRLEAVCVESRKSISSHVSTTCQWRPALYRCAMLSTRLPAFKRTWAYLCELNIWVRIAVAGETGNALMMVVQGSSDALLIASTD